MAETVVYGCDWCKEIVEKDRDGKPRFAATVSVETTLFGPPAARNEYKICATCRKALAALTEGRYRR